MPECNVCLIDYGMGNLHSVHKALERAGACVKISSTAEDIREAQAVVLPGVGAFKAAIEELDARGLRDAVIERCRSGKPFLGICLGLQLLFDSGEEDGHVEGLGILKGKVVRFTGDLKIPHMGWNQVKQKGNSPLFEGIPDESYFYFVHSYYPVPEDPTVTIGETEYGFPFTAAVGWGKAFAVQFHPEKSQTHGAIMLNNFIRIASEG